MELDSKRIVEIVLAAILITVFFLGLWFFASRLGEFAPEPAATKGQHEPGSYSRPSPLLPPEVPDEAPAKPEPDFGANPKEMTVVRTFGEADGRLPGFTADSVCLRQPGAERFLKQA